MSSKKFLFGVLCGVLVLIVALELMLFSTFLIIRDRNNVNENGRNEEYFHRFRSYRVKPSDGFSHEVVSIKNENEDDDPFEKVEVGSLSLVSEFEKQEYFCTGSCYCEEDHNQRRNIGVVKKIPYLLAATTSVSAMLLAKRYFHEECDVQISNLCGLHSVKSEVEECQPIQSTDSKETINEASEVQNSHEAGEYWCDGHCLLREATLDEFYEFWKIADQRPETKEWKSSFEIEDTYKYAVESCEKMAMGGMIKVDGTEDPNMKFLVEQLESVCLEGSKISLIRDIEKKVNEEEVIFLKTQLEDMISKGQYEWATCLSHRGDNINPSIVCKKSK